MPVLMRRMAEGGSSGPLRDLRQHIIDHPAGDVHTGGGNTVAEFHGVIDPVDGVAAARFEQVERQQPAAYRVRGAPAQLGDLGRDGAIGSNPAAGGVGNPTLGAAVDGADAFLTYYKGANVAPGFVDVFLDVEDLVVDAQ